MSWSTDGLLIKGIPKARDWPDCVTDGNKLQRIIDKYTQTLFLSVIVCFSHFQVDIRTSKEVKKVPKSIFLWFKHTVTTIWISQETFKNTKDSPCFFL